MELQSSIDCMFLVQIFNRFAGECEKLLSQDIPFSCDKLQCSCHVIRDDVVVCNCWTLSFTKGHAAGTDRLDSMTANVFSTLSTCSLQALHELIMLSHTVHSWRMERNKTQLLFSEQSLITHSYTNYRLRPIVHIVCTNKKPYTRKYKGVAWKSKTSWRFV